MTPAARYQAAIDILDRILGGEATERALTSWARGARYAGSKDRAAVRDHVFDAVRCKRSWAALGGANTGRGLVLGGLRAAGIAAETVFTGGPHAPPVVSDAERMAGHAPQAAEAMNLPDWLWQRFQDSLGPSASEAATLLQRRAGVHLRVNLAGISRAEISDQLTRAGITVEPHPTVATALVVTDGARRIRQSDAFEAGLVELQDAASQALVHALPLRDGMRVLDYCAGGGGKSLAMAARARLDLCAHDVDMRRMHDLPVRARRSGVKVSLLDADAVQKQAPFDLVLCDAPCSGSGSWRRAPDGKWSLTPERLRDLCDIQASILAKASRLVRPGGFLAYATCSVLAEENQKQADMLLTMDKNWQLQDAHTWPLALENDGFYLAIFQRSY